MAPTATEKSFLTISTGAPEPIQIPKFVIDSKVPGPTFFIISGVHGDEISGNIILLRIVKFFKKNPLKKGKVIALVGVNQSGNWELTREIPETGEDLNRIFPGKENGTIGEKIAHTISEMILNNKPDLVIDLHNDYFFSTPYILIDPKILYTKELHQKNIAYAISSKLNVIQERDDEKEKYKNSLSSWLTRANISALTIEGGPDKLIIKKNVNTVVEAVLNIMLSQKMIDHNINQASLQKSKLMNYGVGVRTEQSGILNYVAEPGKFVKKGEVLAKIYDDFGEKVKNITAVDDAFVLGHSEKVLVDKDEEIYWLAN